MVETRTSSQLPSGRALYSASSNTQRVNSRRWRSRSIAMLVLQYPVLNLQAEAVDLGLDHRLAPDVLFAPHPLVWHVDEQIAQLAVDALVSLFDAGDALDQNLAPVGARGLQRHEALVQAQLELRDDFLHQVAERSHYCPAAGGDRRERPKNSKGH